MSCASVSSPISDIRLPTVKFDNEMSFIVLAARWPNASLQVAIKEGLIISSRVEYGFYI
jgi:hypothetical protein